MVHRIVFKINERIRHCRDHGKQWKGRAMCNVKWYCCVKLEVCNDSNARYCYPKPTTTIVNRSLDALEG